MKVLLCGQCYKCQDLYLCSVSQSMSTPGLRSPGVSMYFWLVVTLLSGPSLADRAEDMRVPQLVLDIDKETMCNCQINGLWSTLYNWKHLFSNRLLTSDLVIGFAGLWVKVRTFLGSNFQFSDGRSLYWSLWIHRQWEDCRPVPPSHWSHRLGVHQGDADHLSGDCPQSNW